MIKELKVLKDNLMRGETTISDVDKINRVIEYVKDMETRIATITEIPEQAELFGSPEGSIYITAENFTINYIGREEQSPLPK